MKSSSQDTVILKFGSQKRKSGLFRKKNPITTNKTQQPLGGYFNLLLSSILIHNNGCNQRVTFLSKGSVRDRCHCFINLKLFKTLDESDYSQLQLATATATLQLANYPVPKTKRVLAEKLCKFGICLTLNVPIVFWLMNVSLIVQTAKDLLSFSLQYT